MKSTEEKIRDGRVWFMSLFGVTVPNAGDVYIGFTTADTFVRLDNRRIDTTSNEGKITFYKDTPYSGGADVGLSNRNQRNAATSILPPVTVSSGVTPDGPLDPNNIISLIPIRSTSQTPVSEEVDSDLDVIFLEKNTPYVVAVNNLSGGATEFDIRAIFEGEEPILP